MMLELSCAGEGRYVFVQVASLEALETKKILSGESGESISAGSAERNRIEVQIWG
jgi:hypothetical protein